jgi:hypothetical protein
VGGAGKNFYLGFFAGGAGSSKSLLVRISRIAPEPGYTFQRDIFRQRAFSFN